MEEFQFIIICIIVAVLSAIVIEDITTKKTYHYIDLEDSQGIADYCNDLTCNIKKDNETIVFPVKKYWIIYDNKE